MLNDVKQLTSRYINYDFLERHASFGLELLILVIAPGVVFWLLGHVLY